MKENFCTGVVNVHNTFTKFTEGSLLPNVVFRRCTACITRTFIYVGDLTNLSDPQNGQNAKVEY